MSLQMELKIERQLLDSVMSFLHVQLEGANNAAKHSEPDLLVLSAFREAFKRDGLDGVDELIAALNRSIREEGGTAGFGEGAALQHADAEHAAFLHISFVDFKSERVIIREAISLAPSHTFSPD